jgi:4-amino-4-deoxy-L-arabinose transferase-like glycosyltransferase
MRNTKPPLLFWQAMVVGDWGAHWSMGALRLPSLIYTLLITAAIGWSAHAITRNLRTALMAACIYLAFFCTYRFGRTYLTSAPETFWFNLPMFWLLWHSLGKSGATELARTEVLPGSAAPRPLGWLTHLGFGLVLGLGLAYKSFALIAPAAATLWCAQVLTSANVSWRILLQTTAKVGLSVLLALGIFALWFVLDPDPGAVWQEFIIGENAGKLSNPQGYWQVALFGGGFSIWAQLLGYAQNAGLLATVVLGLTWLGLRAAKRRWQGRSNLAPLPTHLLILLVWLAVWLAVFTLPSQRSARYLIPAMPALAMLIALAWDHIGRAWFVLSLALCGVFIGVLGRIAWAEHDLGIASGLELGITLLAVTAGFTLLIVGLIKPDLTRACTVAASLSVFACFGLTTAPLNGSAGLYSAQTTALLQAKKIAVPNGFNGQFERFQFLLPGNHFVSYNEPRRDTAAANSQASATDLQQLLREHDAVIWLQPAPSELTPTCLPHCVLLGTRWEVKGRHQSGEITLDNLWYPQTWLFRREWLLAATSAAASDAAH